jgi:lipoprotein-anchoring transpeptidase ErfK/SrfK
MSMSTKIPAAVATALLLSTTPALSQATWSGGAPVYDSDVRRAADQAEAERAERRKAHGPVVYPKFMDGGAKPEIQAAAPPIVHFDRQEEVGSIIVDTQNRKLYYVLPDKKAYQYPISVGRDGFTWAGTERISRIAAWPTWTPPASMHKRQPGLPITVSGGLKNPQGARALYLGSTIYRIHGTNNDRTVGRANSSGCFRLTNEHVVHLASIAKVGTKVKVLQAYGGGVSQAAPIAAPSFFASFFGTAEEPKPAPVAAKAKPKKPAAKKAAQAKPAQTKSASAAPITTGSTPAPAAPEAKPAPKAE